MRVWLLDSGSIVIEHTQLLWNVPGPQVRIPVYSVLIESDDGLFLFDTGIDLDHMNRVLPFELPEQTPEQTIPAQLEGRRGEARIGARQPGQRPGRAPARIVAGLPAANGGACESTSVQSASSSTGRRSSRSPSGRPLIAARPRTVNT